MEEISDTVSKSLHPSSCQVLNTTEGLCVVHSQPGLRRGSLHVGERQMEKVCAENVVCEPGCETGCVITTC